MKWIHVSKSFRCPQCQKPDWCSICPDLNLVLCMRVASDRPSKNAMGGYLHRLDAESKPQVHYTPAAPAPSPTIDAASILESWSHQTSQDQLDTFALELGVSSESLIRLGCCRSASHQAWAFPMFDGSTQPIGIRLRYDNGEKRAVRGSRSGLFIPMLPSQHTVFLPEGPTDTAAAITIGVFAIGRPSCSGGVQQLIVAIKERRIRSAVIIGDNDPDKYRPDGKRYNPGIDGAKALSEALNIPTCTVILPAKDIREFVCLGGTSDLLNSMIKSLIWNQPKKELTSLTQQHGSTYREP